MILQETSPSSETVAVNGIPQDYGLGASTVGLMPDFVWRETDPQTAARLTGDSALIEHRMLVEGQSYFDRQYANDAKQRCYPFGVFENVSICGSGTYPHGSVISH